MTVVLCEVLLTIRQARSTFALREWIGVEVAYPDQIWDALCNRMARLKRADNWSGILVEWDWISYLPETKRPACAGQFH